MSGGKVDAGAATGAKRSEMDARLSVFQDHRAAGCDEAGPEPPVAGLVVAPERTGGYRRLPEVPPLIGSVVTLRVRFSSLSLSRNFTPLVIQSGAGSPLR